MTIMQQSLFTPLTSIQHTEHFYRLADVGQSEYETLSDIIARVFRKAYSADVSVSYPHLLGVYGAEGKPSAALGMRGADEQELFLEHYLDLPAEQAVLAKTGMQFGRHQIAEAGNLASTRLTAFRDLMLALAVALRQQGYEYILFTGTESLKRYLELLGLQPIVYADANPARLESDAKNWGTYYDTHPKVMGGTTDAFYYALLAAYCKKKA